MNTTTDAHHLPCNTDITDKHMDIWTDGQRQTDRQADRQTNRQTDRQRQSDRPSMIVDGQRLKHEEFPVYLSVTVDRTLSHKEHLSTTAAKLKSRGPIHSWS